VDRDTLVSAGGFSTSSMENKEIMMNLASMPGLRFPMQQTMLIQADGTAIRLCGYAMHSRMVVIR
jgi:hypothetical protein